MISQQSLIYHYDVLMTTILITFNKNTTNYKMGSQSSKNIRVATANYSGITYSPYEFNSNDSQDLNQLNHIFQELFQQITPQWKDLHDPLKQLPEYKKLQDNRKGGKVLSNNFDWKINSIDKSIHSGRYCAQYREDAGIEDGKLVTMKKYFERWDIQFTKNLSYVKMKKPDRKTELPLQQQQRICKVFDFLIYKTLVEYCYKQVLKENKSDFYVTLEDRDTDNSKETKKRRKLALIKYEQLQEKYHKKPYLKTDIKFTYIKQLFTNNDVVFLQDCSDQLVNQIKNEGDITIIEQLRGGNDCCILINPKSGGFHRLYNINLFISKQQRSSPFHKQKFNYYDAYPAVCLTDQFLMMSLRFSSRKDTKQKQIVKFMQHMVQIHNTYKGKLKIIVGGDFNVNITQFAKENEKNLNDKVQKKFSDLFEWYPSNEKEPIITTRKQRTNLQSQANKAKKLDESSRDFLLSNCKLLNGRLISNSASLADILPSEKHPFDHFFLSAEIAK